MNGDSTPTKPDASDVYRCNRCGIESKEPSCFVGVAKKGPQRFAVTCVTCTSDAGHRKPLGAFLGDAHETRGFLGFDSTSIASIDVGGVRLRRRRIAVHGYLWIRSEDFIRVR